MIGYVILPSKISPLELSHQLLLANFCLHFLSHTHPAYTALTFVRDLVTLKI